MKIVLGSGIARIWQHFKNKDIAVISAFDSTLPIEENNKRHEQLNQDLKDLGVGYSEAKGIWNDSKEKSFIVFDIEPQQIKNLGEKYDQFAVGYSIGDDFVIENLKTGDIQKYNKMEVGWREVWEGWTEHKGKQFAFVPKEASFDVYVPSKVSSLTAQMYSSFKKGIGGWHYPKDRVVIIDRRNEK